MIGVTILKDGKVVEKHALFGNDEANFKEIVEKQKADPDREYIVYHESEREKFDSILMDQTEDPKKSEWNKMKDHATETEKFLAGMMGLNG